MSLGPRVGPCFLSHHTRIQTVLRGRASRKERLVGRCRRHGTGAVFPRVSANAPQREVSHAPPGGFFVSRREALLRVSQPTGRHGDVKVVTFSLDYEAMVILDHYAPPRLRARGRFISRLLFEFAAREEEKAQLLRALQARHDALRERPAD
jgi:hypothetical protein